MNWNFQRRMVSLFFRRSLIFPVAMAHRKTQKKKVRIDEIKLDFPLVVRHFFVRLFFSFLYIIILKVVRCLRYNSSGGKYRWPQIIHSIDSELYASTSRPFSYQTMKFTPPVFMFCALFGFENAIWNLSGCQLGNLLTLLVIIEYFRVS